jgi:phage FluMu gp28-like protein
VSQPKKNVLEIDGPPLYPKQYLAIFDPSRHCFIEASTKAGKTVGCIIWQFNECTLKVGHHWWVAPVYGQARIAFERAKQYIPDQAIKSVNETGLFIKLINGSTWTFRSGEKPDNLYGEDVHSVVIDEASRCKEAVWIAIRSTLTATRGRTRIIGNVKGRKNWFYKLARRAQSGAEGYAYHKLTAYDAAEGGAIDIREIEEARGDLADHVFAELYLAEPSEDGSNPFGISNIVACEAPLTGKPVACWGIDLAKSQDWTCLVGLDDDGNVAEVYRFQRGWRETTQFIIDIVRCEAMVDSTGVGDPILEDLQAAANYYEGFKFGSVSKQQLMESLALDFSRRAFTIPAEGELCEELKDFEYIHTANGVKYGAPVGLHDDFVCALALARAKFKHRSSKWW